MYKRIIVLVLDSVGVGELPDADRFGDKGCNTLGHIARDIEDLRIPNLSKLGICNLTKVENNPEQLSIKGAYGRSAEFSDGKDTTTGHWEIMGIQKSDPWPYYPQGFPPEILEPFCKAIDREKVLANIPASGTEIIARLGEEHVKTGNPIVYTSGDSVFQIACHEDVVPIPKLYEWCQAARDILTGKHAVARVIARPFKGEAPDFYRTENRHDYSLEPPAESAMDILKAHDLDVYGVGKISDIFCGHGITKSFRARNNKESFSQTLEALQEDFEGLLFINFVDFDMLYGHRNNARGYADALMDFDRNLPELESALRDDDLLIITADHGCDPTDISTDHTREYIPLLITGKQVKENVNLGTRTSFADIAKTVLDNWLLASELKCGTSFLKDIQKS